MKSERFKDFIAKLMANTIFIIIVLVTILFVLGMLTIVPVLLKWVGLQYDGIWSLVGFSAVILILKFCAEGLSGYVIKRVLSRQNKLYKWETLLHVTLDFLLLVGIVLVADTVIETVSLSIVGVLFFALLLTLWELIITRLFLAEDDAE